MLLHLVGADALIRQQVVYTGQGEIGLAQQCQAVQGQGLSWGQYSRSTLSGWQRKDGGATQLRRGRGREERQVFDSEMEIPGKPERGRICGNKGKERIVPGVLWREHSSTAPLPIQGAGGNCESSHVRGRGH